MTEAAERKMRFLYALRSKGVTDSPRPDGDGEGSTGAFS